MWIFFQNAMQGDEKYVNLIIVFFLSETFRTITKMLYTSHSWLSPILKIGTIKLLGQNA